MSRRPVRDRVPRDIHIVGVPPDGAVGRCLKKAFHHARFFHDADTLPLQKVALAVGICERRDDSVLLKFITWAHDAGVPALCVDFRDSFALIGPLTLWDRAGCGRCAFERLKAASATAEPDAADIVALNDLVKVAGPLLVREIREIMRAGPERSQLVGHVLAINALTLDESLHKVIPLPRCSICGGAAAFSSVDQESSRLSPEDPVEVVMAELAGWVDQRTGIVSNLFIEPPGELCVDFPIVATAAPPHIVNEDGSLRRLPLGWGKGLTVSGALLSAVGEAIERYSASLPDSGQIVWESPQNLDTEFIDPRAFGLYTDEQYERQDFPYVRYDAAVRHPWVLGKWLETGAPVWVPAILVFLSITLQREHLVCQGTSNGIAASTDLDDAALRAILELVERDAFMAAWLTGSPGRRVELDNSLDPILRRVLDNIEALGATIEVYSLPTSICGTTILCLGLGDGNHYPGVTFGIASDFVARTALRQAILELGQTGPYLRRMMRSKAVPIPQDPTSVHEMLHHAAYYFPRERATAFDTLRNSDTPIALRDLESSTKRSLASCATELTAAGARVALINVTSADVATGPFRVVRAVSPDLQSIWYGYGLERIPVERIRRMKHAAAIPPINPIW